MYQVYLLKQLFQATKDNPDHRELVSQICPCIVTAEAASLPLSWCSEQLKAVEVED